MKASQYFITTLQLIFITLKICNIITWNWVWVLMPLVAMLFFVCLYALIKGGDADDDE